MYSYKAFTPKCYFLKYGCKTGELSLSLFDLKDVPKKPEANTFLAWDGEKLVWKEIKSGQEDTYKVKLLDSDNNPGFLADKIDNDTIVLTDDKKAIQVNKDYIRKVAMLNALVFG